MYECISNKSTYLGTLSGSVYVTSIKFATYLIVPDKDINGHMDASTPVSRVGTSSNKPSILNGEKV